MIELPFMLVAILTLTGILMFMLMDDLNLW